MAKGLPFPSDTGLSSAGGTITGNLAVTGTLNVTGTTTAADVTLGASNKLNWTGRSQILSGADGVITLENAAGTGFTQLNFGGTTSSFPALTNLAGGVLQVIDAAGNSNYLSAVQFAPIGNHATGVFACPSDGQITWSTSNTDPRSNIDSGIKRTGVGIVAASNGSSGNGDFQNNLSALTAGTLTAASSALLRTTISKYTWTNAQIVALGAVLAGDLLVATLPAQTVVLGAYLVINTQAAGTTTLTAAVGRTSAAYIDYIVASDAQAAANTVYGDASGERGTNLTGYDLPSFTGTTAVNIHFISTGANLSAVTGSTGSVYLLTMKLP